MSRRCGGGGDGLPKTEKNVPAVDAFYRDAERVRQSAGSVLGAVDAKRDATRGEAIGEELKETVPETPRVFHRVRQLVGHDLCRAPHPHDQQHVLGPRPPPPLLPPPLEERREVPTVPHVEAGHALRSPELVSDDGEVVDPKLVHTQRHFALKGSAEHGAEGVYVQGVREGIGV